MVIGLVPFRVMVGGVFEVVRSEVMKVVFLALLPEPKTRLRPASAPEFA